MDCSQHNITVDDVIYKSWSAIGLREDLVTDMDVAQFLVTLYWSLKERDKEDWECHIKCVCCHCPLTLYCNTCRCPSHLATPIHPPPSSLSSSTPVPSSQVLDSSVHLSVQTHSTVADILQSDTHVADVLRTDTPVAGRLQSGTTDTKVKGEQKDTAASLPEAEGDDDSDVCSYNLDIVKTESGVSGCDQESGSTEPLVNFRLMPSMGDHRRRSTRASSRRNPVTASHLCQDTGHGRKKKRTATSIHRNQVKKRKLPGKEQSTTNSLMTETQPRKVRTARNNFPSYTEDVIGKRGRKDSSSENKADESSDDTTQQTPNKIQMNQRKRKPCASQDLEEGHVLPIEERRMANIHVYDESFFERHKIEDRPPGRPGRPKKCSKPAVSANISPRTQGRKKQKRFRISQLSSDSETSDDDEEMSEYQRRRARYNQQVSSCKQTPTKNGTSFETAEEKHSTSDSDRFNQTGEHSETQPTVTVPNGGSISESIEDGKTDTQPVRILVSAQKILPLRTTNGNSAHKFYSYFECAHCKKAFVHKRAFNSHVQTHIDRKVYKCSFCDRSFERLCDRLIHERRHKYQCELCGYKYLEYSKIKEHMKLHAENNDTIKCPGCPFETSDFDAFKKHKTVCDSLRPILQCEICGVRLKSQRALSFHIAAIHKNDRPFKCGLCNKSFVLQTKLNTHIKDRHAEGGKRFHCDKCGYRSFHAQGLKIHQRCVHSSERPYKCTHCPSAFARKAYLTIHIRKHTGEKPHRCSECLQTFTQRPSLTRHIRSHHAVHPIINNKQQDEGTAESSCHFHRAT